MVEETQSPDLVAKRPARIEGSCINVTHVAYSSSERCI